MLTVIIRAVASPAKALIPVIRPLLCTALQDVLHILWKVFPHAQQSFQRQKRQGSVLPVGSIDERAPRLESNCVRVYLFSDGTCGILDDLMLSEEEDIGDVGKTSLSSHQKNAADELLNFSRLVSCYLIKKCNPMQGGGVYSAYFVLDFINQIYLDKSTISIRP